MTQTEAIEPAMIINDVLRKYPQTIAIFHQAGMDACCGGAKSISESASAHGVSLPRLLEALNRAAAGASGAAACSCSHGTDPTVSDYYQHDHEEIDGIFKGFVARLRAGDPAAALTLFDEYNARLERHIEWEEHLLFPAFERGGGPMGPTEMMRMEHRLIRDDKTAIRARLTTAAQVEVPGILRLVDHLVETLSGHNMKEEQILYPMTDQILGDRGRQELFGRMQATAAAAAR